MGAPFVGREREIELLDELERVARTTSAPTLVTVTGVPGSGKTRLLAEATKRSRSRTMRIVGFEPMQSVAMGAAGSLLRELAGTGPEGIALAGLIGGSDDRGLEPVRIFEAVHRAALRVGALRLAIDDLQWVDDRSLALVDYLVRAAESRHQPLSVVVASRPSRALDALIRRADDELPSERRDRLVLGPMTLAAGTKLARTLDPRLDEEGAVELWRRATGSPFYLGLLARAAEPDGATGAIRQRIQGLGRDAGRLLAAASVAGRPILPEDLAAVLSWPLDRVSTAADELEALGLAIESIAGLTPGHDLIREAVLGDLPASQRHRLHDRLADILERDAGDDVLRLREALVHRRAAGRPSADLALRLVGSAQSRLLGREDLRLLAAISDELPSGSLDRAALDEALGSLAGEAGDQELAIDRFGRAAGEHNDPAVRRRAAIAAARAAFLAGNSPAAHAWIDRAGRDRTAPAEASIAIGAVEADVLLWLDHESAAGSVVAARAVATAESLIAAAGGIERVSPDIRRSYLSALEAAADGALQLERPEEIVRFADLSIKVAREIGEGAEIDVLNRAAFAFRPLGLIVDAEAFGRRAWEAARRRILPAAMAEAGHSLARSLRDLGRITEARAIAAETVGIEARLQNPSRRWGDALSVLHMIDMCLGDPAAGLRDLREDARREPNPHYRMAIHQAVAVWLARTGGSTEAIAGEIASADEASVLARCPRCARELRIEGAWLLARIGRADEAVARVAMEGEFPLDRYVLRRIRWLRARAGIAAARGEHRQAIEHLEAVAAVAQAAGLVEELVWALIDVGQERTGADRAAAIVDLRRAAQLSEEIGATTHRRIAERALRGLGVRTWRRARRSDAAIGPLGSIVATLSSREQEVAMLVARGRSNREIGAVLDISLKTVERHITNVLGKLGIRNRTELATLMAADRVRDSPDD